MSAVESHATGGGTRGTNKVWEGHGVSTGNNVTSTNIGIVRAPCQLQRRLILEVLVVFDRACSDQERHHSRSFRPRCAPAHGSVERHVTCECATVSDGSWWAMDLINELMTQ